MYDVTCQTLGEEESVLEQLIKVDPPHPQKQTQTQKNKYPFLATC